MNILAGLGIAGIIGYFGLIITIVVGWIMNLAALFHLPLNPLTMELLLRIVGIIVVPLGAIMGWFF